MADYYKTKDSVEEYIRLAKDVSGASLIKQLNPFLIPGSTLLEIGSGPGTDWKLLSSDYGVVGSDNSEEFLEHLRKDNPEGRFVKLDAVTLDINEQYDAIYSKKVLHHLKDHELEKSIQRQCDLLQPNGIVCHSFWKGEDSEIFKGLFVNYHSKQALRAFFEGSFETLLIEDYAEFEAGDSILFIGRKKPTAPNTK